MRLSVSATALEFASRLASNVSLWVRIEDNAVDTRARRCSWSCNRTVLGLKNWLWRRR